MPVIKSEKLNFDEILSCVPKKNFITLLILFFIECIPRIICKFFLYFNIVREKCNHRVGNVGEKQEVFCDFSHEITILIGLKIGLCKGLN